ncbi:phage tail assembly protein [Mannheimia pernigra]|uniref:phage tail assembly protein n=1 Tax=Mannheimia pernigra TaxID=111844 RepID=UPI00159F4C9F|nr:phage tail assembly protein [Mannheimia pernigra]QLB43537.1 phage tail assembly protein [Mannheimia pernigra]
MANAAQQVLTNLRIQTQYKLKYPLTLPDGSVIESLDVRRPKGRDFRLLDEKGFDPEKDGVKILRFYIQQLTTLVPEDIDELDADDIKGLNNLLEEMLVEGKSDK